MGRSDKSRPTPVTDSAINQFARLGITYTAPPIEQDQLEIMPNAWDSFMAFLSCQTQWRVAAGMAGLIWLGLDYAACKLVLDDIEAAPGTFADLRVMEAAAMPILNEVDA
ncbi:DUF1799 domain-containing protein [Agrobacterium rosae]|uniref:DUF1799 domain-containing protein n=1 Tax=Agrobacterium rosae TaxID=1972867 RepID=A0AAW9F8H4_9HYPH|nr:DUF1799 domain-containing protein [Agrobacterium rosae]MDX8301491.1 DUF1799 domain-containing protein [Agrobacterium rosae]